MAVVEPVDALSLGGALEARSEGLIDPLLFGRADRIEQAATVLGRDLTGLEVVGCPQAEDAARLAVSAVREGRAEAIMKGHLRTDVLVGELLRPSGGPPSERRLSHVFVCSLPDSLFPKPLLVTDAAINVSPDLWTKLAILANAVALAHGLGIARPRVAALSALETVSRGLPSTVDAATLSQMAARGLCGDAVVDGPLSLDVALSADAAATKGLASPVAGQPDILLVPNIEVGNVLVKALRWACDATAAGLVVGGEALVVLPSRTDGLLSRIEACALAHRLLRDGPESSTQTLGIASQSDLSQ